LLRAVDPTLGMKAYLYRFFGFDANYIFMANVIQPPSAVVFGWPNQWLNQ
jgi:hypothetical protein